MLLPKLGEWVKNAVRVPYGSSNVLSRISIVVEITTNREDSFFLSVSSELKLNKGAWVGVWGRMGGHGINFIGRWCWLGRK